VSASRSSAGAPRPAFPGQAGYSLVALAAAVTIMGIMMAAAVPAWRYVMKNEREEELIFRGGQIADAIQRYQKKNGGALPTSMEALVKGKFLRKPFEDPMTKDGKWRLVRQGEPGVGGAPLPGTRPPLGPGTPSPTPSPSATPSSQLGAGSGGGAGVGAFVGVASLKREKGLRAFNGKSHYHEWLFVAGQPRIVGKTQVDLNPRTPAGVPVRPPGATLPNLFATPTPAAPP
jgi:type II secretory pathway pseudopilin PulG